jgi:hypothetical protein
MKKEVLLYDQCAKAVVRDIARRYAMLSVHARLDDATGTVNAPWFNAKGDTIRHRHRDWMKKTVRDLAAYRKSLQSLVADIPEVVQPEWTNYTSSSGKEFEVYYRRDLAKAAADAFANDVCTIVFGTKPPVRSDALE